jgi:hypothetical protein
MIGPFEGRYRFLSNFYPLHNFVWRGEEWPTVEHAYQAAKVMGGPAWDRIRCAETPGQAKRLGSKVVLREDWETVKIPLMYELLTIKFRDPYLFDKLIGTGDDELVEINTWGDTFWGVCGGKGENYLGMLLMLVRDDKREIMVAVENYL